MPARTQVCNARSRSRAGRSLGVRLGDARRFVVKALVLPPLHPVGAVCAVCEG
jgi:hypothetical protein